MELKIVAGGYAEPEKRKDREQADAGEKERAGNRTLEQLDPGLCESL